MAQHERSGSADSVREPMTAFPPFGTRPWLTVGVRGGEPWFAERGVLATGLEANDRDALILDALAGVGPEPGTVICEGPELGPLGARTVVHYDMTGSCRGEHPHVVWDPASRVCRENFPAQLLMKTADPEIMNAGTNLAEHQRPEIGGLATGFAWVLIPAVLWAAASAGHGVREAMNWLSSSKQLARVAAYCRSMGNTRMAEYIDEMMESSAVRQQSVYLAWQALAPVEEIMRTVAASQVVERLDVGSWLGARSVLAISLPSNATEGQQQIVAAIVTLADTVRIEKEYRAGQNTPATPGVWRDLPRPRHWPRRGEWPSWFLVTTASSSQFAEWAGSPEELMMGCHDLLLGARADQESLGLVSALVGRDLPAPPAGQRIHVRARPYTASYLDVVGRAPGWTADLR